MRKKMLLGSAAVLLTIGAAATAIARAKALKENLPEKIPLVEAQTLQFADSISKIQISGFVRGKNHAEIAPLSSGKISKILKKEGSPVYQGETLALINSPQTETAVLTTTAGIESLEKTLRDTEKYYTQLVNQVETAENEAGGSATAQEMTRSAKRARDLQVQSVKNQLVQARGALALAQADKSTLRVTAPFSGIITAVHGQEGGFANFSVPLFSISSSKNFELETYVTASDARHVAIGSTVSLFNENTRPFSGVVTTIAPGSDSQTLKTLLKISLDDPAGLIELGDFLQGEIIFKHPGKVFSVPREAVVVRGGDHFIFTLDEKNLVHEKLVTIKAEQDGKVSIISGLEIDEQIVIKGQQFLVNGLKVQRYAEQ